MAEDVRFPGALLEALIASGRGRRVTARCQTCDRYTGQLTVPDLPPGSPMVGLPMMEMFTRGHASVCLGCRTLNRQSEPFDD
ncbi:hypothetical protein [Actinoplanes sp. CA-252034]|uniref:hypothetical protein n=1 Tax=Actinoplanes sp. CA-252034 TaxID=3239906 RepID=UPI003D9703D9